MQGTPKSLSQAIENALGNPKEPLQFIEGHEFSRGELLSLIHIHVKGFIAQKFSAAMLKPYTDPVVLREVYSAIVGEE